MKRLVLCMLLILYGCQSINDKPAVNVNHKVSDSNYAYIIEKKAMNYIRRKFLDANKINNDPADQYPNLIPANINFNSLYEDENFYPAEIFLGYDEGSTFDKAINALFYTGEFNQPPGKEIYAYMMINYPNYKHFYSEGDTDPNTFFYDYNGEIRSFTTEEPLHDWTIVMPGEEFRQHYYELFNSELPDSLNSPWDTREMWHADGYLADIDMYFYYQYTDGVFLYPGPCFYILNQNENEGMVDVELVKFEIDYIDDFYKKVIYMQDWTLLRNENNKYKTWHELLTANLDHLEKWDIQLYHRTDDTYALLSAVHTKPNDEIKIIDNSDDSIKVYRNYSDHDNRLYDIIPQFNLTGSWTDSVNHELIKLYQENDYTFNIIDNENQAIIEIKNDGDENCLFQYIFDKQTRKFYNDDGYELYNHTAK